MAPAVKSAKLSDGGTKNAWTVGSLEHLKVQYGVDLLKTLVVAYTARTGSGLDPDALCKLARAAKAAIQELG